MKSMGDHPGATRRKALGIATRCAAAAALLVTERFSGAAFASSAVHPEQIYAKLGVENRTSAAALAVRTIGVR
jgi:hypothetical protein